VEFQNEHGYPPSIRELMPLLGVTSLRGVTVHLDALKRKGWIERGRTSRSIKILAIPAAAVDPIFSMRMRGDYMTGDHIADGDTVIVRSQCSGENGDLVAALIDEEKTVRRLDLDSEPPRLLPSNPAYQPVELVRQDVRVLGKVIGLIRNYLSPPPPSQGGES